MRVPGYGAMLRRRWWVALAALVGLLVAVVIPTLDEKTYVATAGVLVLPTGVDSASAAGGRAGGEIDLDAEAQLLKSAEVATRAKALLQVPDEPRDLAANVTVDVPANVSVLNISYSAATPQDAQRSVKAFADAYLDNRAAVATARLKTRAAALQAQIAAVRTTLQQVISKKAALSVSSPERAHADAQERVLIDRIAQLSAELGPIETALAAKVQPGRMITGPSLPTGD